MNSESNKKDLVIMRTFNAPREKVWQAWTDPAQIEQWWGPTGFTTKVEEIDFKPGGKWRYVMIDADGNKYPAEGVFREIAAPERIITSDEFGEELKNTDTSGDLPSGIVLTISFEDLGDKTNMTIHIAHRSVEDRIKHENMGVIGGWNSSLDKLVEYLAN